MSSAACAAAAASSIAIAAALRVVSLGIAILLTMAPHMLSFSRRRYGDATRRAAPGKPGG